MSKYPKINPFIPVLFLIFTTSWLRLVNLGYSDYIGDETKAMWRPAAGQSTIDYLYAQKKGPTQFLVTYLVRFIDPTYSNELLMRLPFTLAGILAIYFFYRLVEDNFNKKIAFISTMLLSVNGLFVGLMRVAQYQPFLILFSVLTLYCFSLALKPKWSRHGIALGVLFWIAGLLSHYDAVFITPFALYLLIRWYQQNADQPLRFHIKYLIVPFVLGGLVLALYFVPYFLTIPGSTISYWVNRLTYEVGVTVKPSSSIDNFVLYNPILGLPVYLLSGLLALLKIKKIFPLLLWFIFPWIVLEVLIYEPGTHIYNYLIPGIILAAFGLEVMGDFLVKVAGQLWGSRLKLAWLAALFATLAGISHLIFVDYTPEYPFEERRILLWKIGGGGTETLLWPYGFPYYRRWEDIGRYVASMDGTGYYYSNEDFSITSYFVPLNHSAKNAGVYIYIYNPQSFARREPSEKAHYWRTHYEPVKIFKYHGRLVAEIYSMPAGGLGAIKSDGY